MTLVNLLETPEIEFQDETSVERAVFFYRSRKVDFAECMRLGCAVTNDRLPLVTFDRQAAKSGWRGAASRPVTSGLTPARRGQGAAPVQKDQIEPPLPNFPTPPPAARRRAISAAPCSVLSWNSSGVS